MLSVAYSLNHCVPLSPEPLLRLPALGTVALLDSLHTVTVVCSCSLPNRG